MILVRLLTTTQKDLLINKAFAYSMKFNPVEDADGNWFISEEEMEANIYKKYDFLKDCPQIEFNPKIEELER